MGKAYHQHSDSQNTEKGNARGAKAMGSTHGQAGRFGQCGQDQPVSPGKACGEGMTEVPHYDHS